MVYTKDLMLVKDLIKILENVDPNIPIVIYNSSTNNNLHYKAVNSNSISVEEKNICNWKTGEINTLNCLIISC